MRLVKERGMEKVMKDKYSDENISMIMSMTTIHNEVIDTRIEETLTAIKQKKPASVRKGTVWRRMVYGLGSVAAVLFVSLGICAANPSMAENIPILGNVFAKVQDIFSFGRISEDETTRLYDNDTGTYQNMNETSYVLVGSDPDMSRDTSGESEQGAAVSEQAENEQDFLYRDYDNGITVTVTEYYASNQAVFLGICIESEEAFPSFAVMGDKGYQLIQAITSEQYSFRDTKVSGARNIEGRLEDAHTFAGIMRVDYDEINIDDSKYEALCREAEEKGEELPTVTEETWDLYYSRFEVPEEFMAQITIESLRGYCREETDAENGNQYRVRGNWEIPPCKIAKSRTGMQTIQIHEVNAQGIGIETIEVSPVELTLHTTEPADCLTFAVVLDKDGKKLASGSTNAYELATVGHDISTVTVYICDYNEYMDEIRVYALEDEEKFRNMLEEKALFKRVVALQEFLQS